MIDYPYLKEQSTSRQTVDVFKGYNANTRIADGEFCQMENMTSDHYPVLSPRGKRSVLNQVLEPLGMYHVPGGATFFTNGDKLLMRSSGNSTTDSIADELLDTQMDRQFALMGTALIIVPDMKWLDIQYPFDGLHSMGEIWNVTAGEIKISLCKVDGTLYEGVTASAEPPSDPENMTLWIDTSASPDCLKQYSTLAEEWVSIPTTYLKISGLTGHSFQEGDGVTISGLEGREDQAVTLLNGSHLIECAGTDYIVITGILSSEYTQNCKSFPIKIARDVPQLDFIVEAGNRLWGCSKGINEIYASKLGDFKNWNVFSGLSTDSWVASIGTPGDFTGAVNHGGYPVFYKQDVKHKVWPSSTGAHQITSTPCHGVEKDSYSSLAQYNGQLLYLSPDGVCMDDGSGPVMISQPLGIGRWHYGVAAVHAHKYYICMTDEEGVRQLFVYDLRRQLWHCEGIFRIEDMVSAEENLYAVGEGLLWDLTGREGTQEDAMEDTIHWRVRTGDLMLSSPDRKYISRLTLRLSLEPGSKLEIYARYDHEDIWVKLGTVYGRKLGSFSLPVRPRRCDNLQLELRGEGMGKVYAITKTFEEGSELR